jgi:hypothetical protein
MPTMPPWEIEGTDEFQLWYDNLIEAEQEAIEAAVEVLEEDGPALKRPLVGEVGGSRHGPGLKELIPPGGNLRILFRFDPRRTGILLLGGDKTGQWKEWYRDNIEVADDLYEVYLGELREEGVLR